MDWDIRTYAELDSTNTQARRMAQEGVGGGLVVVAEKQSAGRGRQGRSWESPAGENLYFSILLQPELAPENAPMLTLVMAYSVARVLREREVFDLRIKWPNDLVLAGKKVCGILTEMHLEDEKIEDVIVGVGINVNTRAFPAELVDKASSLFLESGNVFERQSLLEEILKEFAPQYERFLKVQDLSFLQEDYNALLVNREREVRVLEPGAEYEGIAKGINARGELLVESADGELRKVFAGEVSVRGLYGYV